ncbi:glycosyltransferase family 1 protein [Mucor lusitanicus]|uniref:Glycosyltransferase family 1 protein n=2 Tax=Mucor circinelloides f. lusitanicus TaxID=29924 RepID=A0A168PY38_MUCCL|nr:glycosyltransferase family 1 protein [Mucor lusitanicus CBS 277.49]
MKVVLSLIASCLMAASLVASVPDQGEGASNTTLQTFRQPKNIAFSVFSGGSSHANWALSIIEELSKRGHATIFLTKDGHKKFGKNFPSIETVSLGDDTRNSNAFKLLTENIREATLASTSVNFIKVMEATFEEDYKNTLEFFKSREIDVAVCDHFCISCQEACTTLQIPFLITNSLAVAPDTEAPYINSDDLLMRVPTSLEMTFGERVYKHLIEPVEIFFKTYKLIEEQKQRRLALGIKDPVYPHEERWKNSIKLFNTAFGFEPARPLGPLVEFIGPIIPKTAASVLTKELDQFLISHQRVAYIAFGQHAVSTESEITVLLAGLLEAYEAGDIDGIIWSTRGLGDIFPSTLTTESNTTYAIHEFMKQETTGNIVFLDWAPQTAILEHPSTIVFVTHAGAGSWHEGLNAGKRLVFFPFFADQPVNSLMGEKFGMGLKVNYKGTRQEAAKVIKRVARDEDGFFQANIKRFQALVQIKSKAGVSKGADLVEEVAFMHQNTLLHHRRDVKHDLSYIKAHSLDVYAFGFVAACLPMFAAMYSLSTYFKSDNNLHKKVKIQ